MPRPLASLMSRPPHSRTWLTLPGADSRSPRYTVWIESTIRARGSVAATWASMVSSCVSARMRSSDAASPSRSARSLTCAADSSPDT